MFFCVFIRYLYLYSEYMSQSLILMAVGARSFQRKLQRNQKLSSKCSNVLWGGMYLILKYGVFYGRKNLKLLMLGTKKTLSLGEKMHCIVVTFLEEDKKWSGFNSIDFSCCFFSFFCCFTML